MIAALLIAGCSRAIELIRYEPSEASRNIVGCAGGEIGEAAVERHDSAAPSAVAER